ncbi:MAG: HAD family phosphatase [Parachlamydiaceae bacterium]|nr:HAD family phosphatase [Parachlamydiaceae bacterium]
MNIKALLVDFDGTLVNSVPALWKCYQAFLQQYNVLAIQAEFNQFIGPSLLEITKTLKWRYGLPGSVEDLHREYLTIISRRYVEGIELFPEALAVLNEMKGSGMHLALVTSAPYGLVHAFFEQYSLQNVFEKIIAYSSGEPSKPDPAPYKRALRELNVLPDEAIAIEDSENGITSARGAGIVVIEFSEQGGWNEVRAQINLMKSTGSGQ